MPQITLPDNSKRSYDQPVSIDEVARDIGSGLAKATVAGKINGKLVDASETITEDCKLQIVTIEDNEGLEIVRHSCSKVTNEENDAYFLSRPRGSQISASVSFQSKEISSYEDLVERSKAFEEENLNKEIQRPARWGGFILTPDSIEFWIDQRNRLHKRYLYTKEKKDWKKTLLSP